MVQLITSDTVLDADTDGKLYYKSEQYIPPEHVSQLLRGKIKTESRREGEFMLAAQVPQIVAEIWKKRDGFDVMVEPIRKVIARLHAFGLDAFVITTKRV
jgi:hypothetical protein